MGNFANNLEKFRILMNGRGFFQTLIHSLKKITGILDCERGLETLNYFLNHYVDITKLHPATGNLRKLQLCDTEILSIIDLICEKNGLRYWISDGTLLGAVRHKGFIPWDDDLDICMPREDYNKACEKLPDIFASFGEDSITCSITNSSIGLGYETSQTGIWGDIFPVDNVIIESNQEYQAAFSKRYAEYRKFYRKHSKNLSSQELAEKKAKIINFSGDNGHNAALAAPEFEHNIRAYLFEWDEILPLKTIEFEGYELKAPFNPHKILIKTFGDYMKFPTKGLEIHSSGKTPVSELASQNGVNMDEILEKLKAMKNFYKS